MINLFECEKPTNRRLLLTSASLMALYGCLPKTVRENLRRTDLNPGQSPQEGVTRKSAQNNRPIEKQTMKGCLVALTVGHGLNLEGQMDLGAINHETDIIEYILNSRQAELVAEQLSLKGATVDIFHYREGYKPMTLFEQGQATNLHQIHVSLHHNFFSDKTVQGSESLVDPRNMTQEDLILAGLVNQRMVHWTGLKDRKVKEQSLGILKGTPKNITKCLTEPFFISESGMTPAKANDLAVKASRGIAEGIELYWTGKNNSSSLAIRLASEDKDFMHFQSISKDSLRALPVLAKNDLPGLYDNH